MVNVRWKLTAPSSCRAAFMSVRHAPGARSKRILHGNAPRMPTPPTPSRAGPWRQPHERMFEPHSQCEYGRREASGPHRPHIHRATRLEPRRRVHTHAHFSMTNAAEDPTVSWTQAEDEVVPEQTAVTWLTRDTGSADPARIISPPFPSSSELQPKTRHTAMFGLQSGHMGSRGDVTNDFSPIDQACEAFGAPHLEEHHSRSPLTAHPFYSLTADSAALPTHRQCTFPVHLGLCPYHVGADPGERPSQLAAETCEARRSYSVASSDPPRPSHYRAPDYDPWDVEAHANVSALQCNVLWVSGGTAPGKVLGQNMKDGVLDWS